MIGDAVRVRLGLDVDLSNPDLVAYVEVDSKELLVSAERLRGAGGLPVGSSGRALVLLSGGLDSPVAAYRMMKRGLRCDFVHFSGRPFTGPESIYKAYALAGRLDRFQGDSRLFVVSFGTAQRRLATAGAGRLQVLSQRRLMVKVASALGRREGAEALVTGDSLGQVASQTLPNLAVVEEAAGATAAAPADRPRQAGDRGRSRGSSAPTRSRSCPTRTAASCSPRSSRSRAASPTTCARSSAPPTSRSWWTRWSTSAELHHPRLEQRAIVSV